MKFVAKQLNVKAYTIWYQEWLPDHTTGETIVCVHGFPGSSSDFSRLMKHFQTGCRIISINLLGSGTSDSPPGVYFSIEDHAEYLIEMIRLLGEHRISLIGHSYGGAVCLATCAKAPELFYSLILLASIGSVPHVSHRRYKPGLIFGYYFLRLPGAYSLIRPAVSAGFEKLGLSPKMAQDENRLKMFYETVIKLDFNQIGEFATRVKCPTLYISCKNDRLVDPAVRKDLEKKIACFQYAELTGHSHFLQHTHTSHVKEILCRFLDQVNRGDETP